MYTLMPVSKPWLFSSTFFIRLWNNSTVCCCQLFSKYHKLGKSLTTDFRGLSFLLIYKVRKITVTLDRLNQVHIKRSKLLQYLDGLPGTSRRYLYLLGYF